MPEGFDFSFSGLKTAVIRYVKAHPDVATADVAASFQKAAVELLVDKARRAARETGATTLCLGGGVAANSLLRERILDVCEEDGLDAVPPQPGDVHRQRGHGRRRRLVALQLRRPQPPRHRGQPQPPPGLEPGKPWTREAFHRTPGAEGASGGRNKQTARRRRPKPLIRGAVGGRSPPTPGDLTNLWFENPLGARYRLALDTREC